MPNVNTIEAAAAGINAAVAAGKLTPDDVKAWLEAVILLAEMWAKISPHIPVPHTPAVPPIPPASGVPRPESEPHAWTHVDGFVTREEISDITRNMAAALAAENFAEGFKYGLILQSLLAGGAA